MLHINDLVYRIEGRPLFEGATLAISEGQKLGLVGPNGAGKSTLLRLIRGEISPDAGSIVLRPGARMASVAQEAPGGADSAVEHVLGALPERSELLARLVVAEEAHDGMAQAEIHARLAEIGAHAEPSRAARILSGLGFNEAMQAAACSSFSGGWRMRIALARTLFANADVLLLDEPTNHLDLEATMWLESHLATYPGTLIVVSHDRDLLNAVTDRIAHVDGGKLVAYRGNFDQFLRQRAERREHAAKAVVRVEAERKKLQAFIDRFRAKATKAAQAQSRVKALERLGSADAPPRAYEVAFSFPSPETLAPPLLAIDDVTLGYGDAPPVLRGINLRIDQDDRIALLGANGNGKSTLMKLLAGRLEPRHGRMVRPSKLRIGYFAQHQTDELIAGDTAFQHMKRVMPGVHDAKVRAQLGRFGLAQARGDTAVEQLSGGEKARLLFALVTRDAPHLLLLDEPTNHLDIEARDALIEAVNEYTGAVVFIAHDRRMVELAAERLWLVADGRCKPYEGDLDDYRKLLLETARVAPDRGGAATDAEAKANKRDQRRAAAERREKLKPLKNLISKAENEVERLTRERDRLAALLADPTFYDGPPADVARATREKGQVDSKLAAAEERWLAALDTYERAESDAMADA
ncbi:glycosyl transferase family 1 [Tistrella bauzanensis]|uniref:Glycosyl transferase family 1 n=1 Tax=Tistrella bauzanensis TaxID=657419 RepID=A0ABQ1J3Q9_9PROT|nr:ABC-F family ATP-binding cassette domain-containing protein [Tistrella bauzanensis]GGB58089.1 glycosyl transferase family 1 [Tistrella bauzanensis]